MDYTGLVGSLGGVQRKYDRGSCLHIPGVYDHSYSVDCVILDEYSKARGLTLTPRKLLIKMDIERPELNVLRGAVGVFEYEQTVIVEFND